MVVKRGVMAKDMSTLAGLRQQAFATILMQSLS